uniref:Uncharacterized protein n=1 Tax=Caenorhabditis tropicalis TaxID=1561998 RepID=A0A1I7TRK3_9PELO
MHSILVASSLLISIVLGLPTALNTVQDARNQDHKLLRCWERVNKDESAGYALSDPIYPLCSFMTHPKDHSKFYVNGVEESSDDYTNIYKIYSDVADGHAVINVCLQEAFQFGSPKSASQTTFRCLCKRDGCNIPKDLVTFLDFNKQPIPQF